MRAVLSLAVVLAACQFSLAADATVKTRPVPKPIPVVTTLPNSIHERAVQWAEDRKAIIADLIAAEEANSADLKRLFPTLDVFKSESSRNALRTEGVAALRAAAQLDLETLRFSNGAPLAPNKPISQYNVPERMHWMAVLLTALGDSEGVKPLLEFSGINPDAVTWPSELLTSDGASQAKIADELKSRITANPADQGATQAAVLILRRKLLTDADAFDALHASLKENAAASTPFVRTYLAKAEFDAKKKAVAADVGSKELAITGTLVTGQPFTSADWKGKVVLVDFWATWCGPCKAELPRLKGLYKQYHDQGLEVIGVSNDYSKTALDKFVAADPDMPWPHLFDPKSAEENAWHPLTKEFGINGIPTLYAIDRKGVLRSVTARAELETLIPKLIAEPAE